MELLAGWFWSLLVLWTYHSSITFDLLKKLINSFFFGVYCLLSKLGTVEIGKPVVQFFIINGTVGGLVLVFACFMYYSLKVDKF